MTDPLQDSERIKYETVWSDRSYRKQADGEPIVEVAFKSMGCKSGETLIDFGCGCGRPAALLQAMGLQVTGIDIAKNCLDEEVDIPLVVGTLWDSTIIEEADYAFSTDVLEHIPPEKLEQVLDNIYTHTRKAAFLQICYVLDTSGPKMIPPQRLHLSVYPPDWWLEQLCARWQLVTSHPGRKTRQYFVCFR